MNKIKAQESLDYLKRTATDLGIYNICYEILHDTRFFIWSGSGHSYQHHYGTHGLIVHTAEVVELCLVNNKLLDCGIPEHLLFLAAFYHDIGKMWDYKELVETGIPENTWISTPHKRHIHHISRSAIVWSENNKIEKDNGRLLTETEKDEVLHAILAHHGQREWGSPVSPNTKLAWMLHLCDGISARMDDATKWDQMKKQ